ncbi:MAG: YsnF/AvaK domain-containing protein [Methylobacter sp.]|jgi:stress response protein YsnF|uniref:YsnF/AvaK domain-containing protein n=1 Tax=Methylobacter sp. TaxID=2051955 RepID=UPI0025E8179D|nr:YsnF/AvaK domain-containing protein [Methylobacter sp.]MCK9620275.1 YsnF/AvaK domain-containing protein [Methylobacter sp.]
MKQTVIGMFDDVADAQDAVQQLLDNGFSRASVDVSTQKSNQSNESFSNFFSSLFGQEKSSSYAEAARQCDAIVTVHAESEDEAWRAGEILDEAGALDVDEQAEQYGADMSDRERAVAESGREETTIPIIEEQLNVGKKEVERGRAKLRSRIVERPVEESLRLREEHVHVERMPVDRPATEADLASFKEGEVELTEHTEIPVVSKESRVVEEVRVGKEVKERKETVRDTVRKTEVDVQQSDASHR